MANWRGVRGAVLCAALLFCCALPAAADDRAGWSYRLAHEVMSPYCPGLALADCPSGQAAELRAWIVKREREGATRAEVEAVLFARYGEMIRQRPTAEGLGWLAYAAPLVTLLAGGALVGVFLVRARKRAAPIAAGAASAAPATAAPAGDAARQPPQPGSAQAGELARRIDAELDASER